MLEVLLAAIGLVFQPMNLLLVVFGAVVGIIVGVLPGIGASMTISLFLPFTFGMHPASALMLIGGIYCGAIYGGSILAILVNAPGEVASVATGLDGFAMTQKGQPVRAIGIATTSSLLGGWFSTLSLLLMAPVLARLALNFSAAETLMLALFGLSIISSLSEGGPVKGLLPAAIGLCLGTVGYDLMSGVSRFTLDVVELSDGLPFMPVLIGCFALSQAFDLAKTGGAIMSGDMRLNLVRTEFLQGAWDAVVRVRTWIQSAIIGVIVGIMPGAGASAAALVSYSWARQSAPREKQKQFGKGLPEGLVAAETANNAEIGGALVPALTLGIPGNTSTAVLLGGLMIHGMRAGPMLFRDEAQATAVYAFILSLFVANIAFWLLAYLGAHYFARLAAIKAEYLVPLVVVLCVVGVYGLNNRMFDVWVAFVFGVVGYYMRRYGWSTVTLILAMILGPIAEESLRRALLLSDGSWMVFITRPISAVLLALTILSLLMPYLTALRNRRRPVAAPQS